MPSIPEDSVLRRHYLADIARQKVSGKSPSSPSVSPAATSQPAGGILGFFKRLLGG